MAAEAEGRKNTRTEPRGGYLQRQWSRLSTFQLVLFCVATALLASGGVGWTDILYTLASTAYFVFFAVKFLPPFFKAGAATPVDQAALLFKDSKMFQLYMTVAAFLGLLVPCIFILAAALAGFEEGLASAAPHLFLLVAQIISETGCADIAVSDPMRGLVPTTYNAKRLVTLADWTYTAISREAGSDQMLLWQVFEAILAIANLVFWSYNLLGFLLPIYLPAQFRFYFQQESEYKKASAKHAE